MKGIRLCALAAFAVLVVFARAVGAAVGEDPDTHRTICQMIQAKGYNCEEHNVTTEDGYILTLFRVPAGYHATQPNPKPLLLQHGLGASAYVWMGDMPYESLAYIAADAGFDVWLGNARGNRYSLHNVRYSPSQDAFWDFSWDEMAMYDIPAMIQYILKITSKPKLSYVGHSQGTATMFASLILDPSQSASINSFAAMGPVARLQNMKSEGLRLMADLDIGEIYDLFGSREFPPDFSDERLQQILAVFCREFVDLCANVEQFFAGAVSGPTNASRNAVFAFHNPGGTSTKNLIHWAQGVRSGNFQMYDYGAQENRQRYNSTTPPLYDIRNFPKDLPISLYSGGLDVLADPTDVTWLYHALPSTTKTWSIYPYFAHSDFARNIQAFHILYPDVLTFLLTYA